MKIDLRRYWLPIRSDLQRALRAFAKRHPGVEVCTVGVYGDGFHGFAALYLDTPAHSAKFVREWAGHGSVLQDAAGPYCSNCPDFEYAVGDFPFPDYPDLYQSDADDGLTFISLDGTALAVDGQSGDEGIHRHVFPFLKQLAASLEPFSELRRSTPFRVGVQMIDSCHVEFRQLEVG